MAVRYGYVRVSTAEQNEERQIKAIKGYAPDIPIENIFVDKISGKKYDRPNYLAMKQLILNVKKCLQQFGKTTNHRSDYRRIG